MTNARSLCAAICLMALCGNASGQGLALNGIGPINQSMGGATVAAPIDAAGALHWNPAAISGLSRPETSFGVSLAKPSERLESSIRQPIGLSGSTKGDPGVSPIPFAAFVDRKADSRFTYGLGVFGVGGFRASFPASAGNPILTPPPPNGFGVGRLFGEAQLLQIVPTVSWACTDTMSFGIAPTVSLAKIDANPLLLAAPDDANGDGFPTSPAGGGSRYHWGGGLQIGWYYIGPNHWHFGASLKSKQWFEQFEFQTQNELGQPRDVFLRLEYPTILSVGTGYTGFENVLLAADVRYFDYEHAAGLGSEGFENDGALAGLGWDSIIAVALGMQLELTDSCSARIGYTYNSNPISDAQVSANVASPVITQHLINLGLSKTIRNRWICSLAYTHGFENEVAGPIVTQAGPIPSSRVASIVSLDGLSFGITVQH